MSNTLYSTAYNPDVLSCLANLSNDEVFTPPSVVNAMLDMLPQELFSDPNATFLDPACKSGVFLREIAKRLLVGLAEQIPDLQERIDHIFHKQLFGIGITELTSLLARRSVYCSKYPNSVYSVSKFDDASGNIRFKRIQHRWKNGRCEWCGASEDQFGEKKREGLEAHAYEFIHTGKLEEMFGMKFDVIIGNPPYQLGDGGGMGSSAIPIYNQFVERAKRLSPRFLSMIIPARWFSGGRELHEFRKTMLNDKHIRKLHDFPDASLCFPGVEIKGGVCFFLWDRENEGDCAVYTHLDANHIKEHERPLLEKGMDTFIRYDELISVLAKVRSHGESTFDSIVSANDPFGFDMRENGSYKRIKPEYRLTRFDGAVSFYYNGWRNDGIGYIKRSSIRKGTDLVDKYKVLIPKAWGVGNMLKDWLNPLIVEPQSCCTETYLVVGTYSQRTEAENVVSYIQTKFFHALVSMMKITQNSMQGVYSLVPMQDFSKPWTDAELYAKYGLVEDEIAFIESMIKPME